ncbi:MAG: hypothetical protein K0M45_04450 [Candidatus Paracaedibacteraceae bacterium]|nr:hypothetical protein [Candidatus Paracaedibacteraceae bacterium]
MTGSQLAWLLEIRATINTAMLKNALFIIVLSSSIHDTLIKIGRLIFISNERKSEGISGLEGTIGVGE